MKIIALGDIHGRPSWKDILGKEDHDLAVFIGDYFDSRERITGEEQLENFRSILHHMEKNPGKIVLLLGNHDFHYLPCADQHYLHYQPEYAEEIRPLLETCIGKRQIRMCFEWDRILFSHAGVTRTWCSNNNIVAGKEETAINDLFYNQPGAFQFSPGENFDPSGNEVTQSPIWVRPPSLIADCIPGYIQVVGHTTTSQVVNKENLFFIDTLGTSGEYLVSEGTQIRTGFI